MSPSVYCARDTPAVSRRGFSQADPVQRCTSPKVRFRFRVTELKYVVLEPVDQIIKAPGWSLRV